MASRTATASVSSLAPETFHSSAENVLQAHKRGRTEKVMFQEMLDPRLYLWGIYEPHKRKEAFVGSVGQQGSELVFKCKNSMHPHLWAGTLTHLDYPLICHCCVNGFITSAWVIVSVSYLGTP